jgi:fructoselysine-6-P-deglycase FrlB-like protein
VIPETTDVSTSFADQPAELRDLVARVAADERLAALTAEPTGIVKFIGMGASYFAAGPAVHRLVAAGVPALRLTATEAESALRVLAGPNIFLSASARTSELAGPIAQSPGLLITGHPQGPLADAAHDVMALGYRRDSEIAMTSFTATVTTLGMLADALISGAPDPEWQSLPELVAAAVAEATTAARGWSQPFTKVANVDVVASDAMFGIAQEVALLFREALRIPAAAFTERQYLHGAIESAAGSGIVLIDAMAGDAEIELRDNGATVFRCHASGPEGATERLEPVLATIALQRFVLALAEWRGVQPGDFGFAEHGTKLAATI